MSAEIDKTNYAVRNIRHFRGNDFLPLVCTFKQRLTSSDPFTPRDLTGSTFSLNVINEGDTTKTALLRFEIGAGITLSTITGQVTLYKTAAQMASLPAGRYVYDLQETNGTVTSWTWIRGLFIVEDDTTIP